jgi:hypothetical protein
VSDTNEEHDRFDFQSFRKHNPIAADKLIPDQEDYDADMIVETLHDRAAALRMAYPCDPCNAFSWSSAQRPWVRHLAISA